MNKNIKQKPTNESASLNAKKAAGAVATQKEVQYPQLNNSLKNGLNAATFFLKDLNILDLHTSSVAPSTNTTERVINATILNMLQRDIKLSDSTLY